MDDHLGRRSCRPVLVAVVAALAMLATASAAAAAAPVWERVSRGRSFDWHDHRIHWMSPIDPPKVRQAPDQPHHVFDWAVPGSLGGEQLAISGSLDYEPPPASGFNVVLIAPVVALALAGGIFWWARRRRVAA